VSDLDFGTVATVALAACALGTAVAIMSENRAPQATLSGNRLPPPLR
jgi:hypothetical protein